MVKRSGLLTSDTSMKLDDERNTGTVAASIQGGACTLQHKN